MHQSRLAIMDRSIEVHERRVEVARFGVDHREAHAGSPWAVLIR
jgi:hypothetical protein